MLNKYLKRSVGRLALRYDIYIYIYICIYIYVVRLQKVKGKTEGRTAMTGRRGRRSKKLLDDLKEKRGTGN